LAEDELEIWLEIRRNGECGARRLVAEYGDRLFAAACLLCRNEHDAEELVFRTLDQSIRKIRTYEPKADFFNWLYAIMLNFRRMDLRKKRVPLVAVGTTLDLPEHSEPFLAELVREAGGDALARALHGISPLLREVVERHYLRDESVVEIAERLDVPAGTVKSRLHNAREVLRGLLENERNER